MRPSKLQNLMDIANVVAERSHDAETRVGAVLVKNDSSAIIASSFNGFVRGAPDRILPSTRPAKYSYILHAEHNIITNCARHGVSMEGTTLICTLTPCVLCMRLLWQCGITHVVAGSKYRDFDSLLEIKDLKVEVELTPEGFYQLTYGVKDDSEHQGSTERESPNRDSPVVTLADGT